MVRKLSIILLISLICTSLSVAAIADGEVNFGGTDEEQVEDGEVIDDETVPEDGTDIPESEEDTLVPDESCDSSAPEVPSLDGGTLPESDVGVVPEKTDPFVGIVPDVLDPFAVGDSYAADLLLLPDSAPIGGYYTSVTSSIGSGDLFVPVDYANNYLTFDGSGNMICLSNDTMNALLVTDFDVIQVRFPAMSTPQYYVQQDTNYWHWVDFDITSAQGGNVQVMQQFDFAWISDNLFEACMLLIGGVLVCKVFMSK